MTGTGAPRRIPSERPGRSWPRWRAAAAAAATRGIANYPDPDVSANSIGINLRSAGIEPNSPRFHAAQQACHLPGAPSGGGR